MPTPQRFASYDAAITAPPGASSGHTPTGRPRSAGSSCCSHDAKKLFMSRKSQFSMGGRRQNRAAGRCRESRVGRPCRGESGSKPRPALTLPYSEHASSRPSNAFHHVAYGVFLIRQRLKSRSPSLHQTGPRSPSPTFAACTRVRASRSAAASSARFARRTSERAFPRSLRSAAASSVAQVRVRRPPQPLFHHDVATVRGTRRRWFRCGHNGFLRDVGGRGSGGSQPAGRRTVAAPDRFPAGSTRPTVYPRRTDPGRRVRAVNVLHPPRHPPPKPS